MASRNSKVEMCDIFSRYLKKKGSGFFGTNLNGFDGILQNMVLNIFGGLFMILMFALLRERAWGYGILAYLHRKKQLFVAKFPKKRDKNKKCKITQEKGNDTSGKDDIKKPGVAAALNDFSDMEKGDGCSKEPMNLKNEDNNKDIRRGRTDSAGSIDGIDDEIEDMKKKNVGFAKGFLHMFTIDDQKILEKCGADCLHYLRFQRHLILLAFIITFFSLTVALPLNYKGGKPPTEMVKLRHLSMNNLKKLPHLLWVHVVLGMIFMVAAMIIMRHFCGEVDLVEENTAVHRTVMISGIARRFCTEERVRKHFEEIYEGVEISEVSLGYDIMELQYMDYYRDYLHLTREYWVQHAEKHSIERPMAKLACCSVMCPKSLLCCYSKQDAIKYYEDEEILTFRELMYERRHCMTRPIGFAFVTFRSLMMTVQAVADYRWSYRLLSQSPESGQSRKLASDKWNIRFAPTPQDIYWENLAFGLKAWYFKAVLVNISLALIVAIYSTPAFIVQIVVNIINDHSKHKNATNATTNIKGLLNATEDLDAETAATFLQGLILNTLPTLVLWATAVTLPSLVSLSDKFIWYWTKTTEHNFRMIKSFVFLVLMVIILPSLGATSFIKILADGLDDFSLSMECVFSSDNGVWFTNYICTSTFVGTASELLRFPELFLIMVQLAYADSKADLNSIKKSVLWEFPISSQYAWMMLNFAIFSIFSVIFPVITVFGFLYLVFKHFVDRYNIYFAYTPIKLNYEIHASAVKLVLACMLLLQSHITAYVFTSQLESKNMDLKGLKLLAIFGMSLPIVIFACHNIGMCLSINPLMFRTRLRRHFAVGPLMKPLRTRDEVADLEKEAIKEAELYFQRVLYPNEKNILIRQVQSEYEFNSKKNYVSPLLSDPPPPVHIYPYEKTKEEMTAENWEGYIKTIDEKQLSVYLFEVSSRPFPKEPNEVRSGSKQTCRFEPSNLSHFSAEHPNAIRGKSASVSNQPVGAKRSV